MTHLFLVRNGETAWNAEGRYQGQADPALNERGAEQAKRLGDTLKGIEFDVAYTSDLGRAQSTAEILAEDGLWVFTDSRWRELSFGEWEGKRFEEIAELDTARLREWVKDPIASPPPGGESMEQLSERVRTAAAELCEQYPHGNVLVITHGGPIRCLIAEWALGGLQHMSEVQTEPGSVTLLGVEPADSEQGWSAQIKQFATLGEARHA